MTRLLQSALWMYFYWGIQTTGWTGASGSIYAILDFFFRHCNHPEFWAYAASAPEFTCRILQTVKLQVRGPNL